MYRQLTPLSEIIESDQWPANFFQSSNLEQLLEAIYVVEYHASADNLNLSAAITLIFEGETILTIPGLSGVSLALGVPPIPLPPPTDEQPAGDEVIAGPPDDFPYDSNLLEGWTQLMLGFGLSLIEGMYTASIYDFSMELRFESNILQPLDDSEYVAIGVRGDASIDEALNLTFTGFDSFDLAPCQIGETGLIFSAQNVSLDLSRQHSPGEILSAGYDDQFLGFSLGAASIQLPDSISQENSDPVVLHVTNCVIGDGGISGTFGVETALSAKLFGFEFELTEGFITIQKNTISSCQLAGTLQLPFFDEPLGLDLSITNSGDFLAALSQTDNNGLIEIDIPNLGILTISSLGFSTDEGDVALIINGTLQLTLLDLNWPAIDLQELRIGPDGSIQLPNGWIDLQEPIGLDLFGFGFEITRLGFGNTDDGRRWIGLNGGLNLIPMLPTGASVEGLRVIWDPTGQQAPEITLDGVGIDLTLPNVLSFSGDVAFVNEATERYFKGNAKLKIMPIGLEIDAAVKIGHNTADDYKYIYTYLDLTPPIGIPIFATGAAIYGIAGLYGMNVAPSAQDSDWYGWYTGPPEKFNITNADKWIGEEDGKAFGAGMTLGTMFDAGRVVSAKALFAMVLPGPVIILHGMANFLEIPPDVNDPQSEGVFNMLAVLDALAGNLQLNIDAGWGKPNVLDISATAEAYFDFANPRNWHVYLGQDQPEDRRIRADVLSLFHGDAYLMISHDGIATGASISWGADWQFGPVKAVLRAWLGGAAAITWQPPQLEGSINLGGEFEVSVAGFGIGVGAEATLSGKAPTLYRVKGELELWVKLPTPLKDLREDICLEWQEEKTPPFEEPFVTAGLEHLKVDETWTDLPDVDLTREPGSYTTETGPVVPLDARISIVFDRNMTDLTGENFVSVNAASVEGDKIGDYTFHYELQDVKLEKWSKAGGTAWEPVDDIYGSWMAIEDDSSEPAFTRLQIGARSPFDFTRQTSRTYRDAFLANHLHWPCLESNEPETHCVEFPENRELPLFFEHQGLHFTFVGIGEISVRHFDEAFCGTHLGLDLADGPLNALWIVFPEPVRNVQICIDGFVGACSAYVNGSMEEFIVFPEPGLVSFEPTGVTAIAMINFDDAVLARICYQIESEAAQYDAEQDHLESVEAGMLTWNSEDDIFEPETWYRLTVADETVRTKNGVSERESHTNVAFFQTAGPPGVTPEWGLQSLDSDTAELSTPPYPQGGKLTDLQPYITWTIPADGAQPVYRAYDLGADFNENYVEQMYGADMAIRLLDSNNQPVTDADGNTLVFPNTWAEQPIAELSETEYPYVTRVEDCVDIPGFYYTPDQKIIFSNCVLLEEDFSGDLDQWEDPSPDDGGEWTVQQGTLYYDGAIIPTLGALLLAGEDDWDDYAIEVALTEEGADVGLAARYTSDGIETYYRLRLNATGRSFVRVEDGVITVLWEDHRPYTPGDATTLGLYCFGARFRGQLDDNLLFDIEDVDGPSSGKVGIFANTTASFDHFLVRKWPADSLAAQTFYQAELIASFPLFNGGLRYGWTDAAYAWTELTKNNARLAAIGRPEWDDYRLEVNIGVTGNHIGAFVRFEQNVENNTFSCYRLLINSDEQKIRLVRLSGSFSGDTYSDTSSEEIWVCEGSCDFDFEKDTHDVAITCEGPTLAVEINGQLLVETEDPGGLTQGRAGLYFLGDEDAVPDFSELVVRLAPRKPVHNWHFVTSRYAGFVEHLDTFAGIVYSEPLDVLDNQLLTDTIIAAATAMEDAQAAVDAGRAALDVAEATDVAIKREAMQQSMYSWLAVAAENFDALSDIYLPGGYRPLPPVVELSEIVHNNEKLALLLESPEPLDWSRMVYELRYPDENGILQPLNDVLVVWSQDGTRAFIVDTHSHRLQLGQYELQLTYHLDVKLEAPLLRRSGSTLPEIAVLNFTL